MILVDAGPLVAAASRTDRHHDACVAALLTARAPRLVSPLVIAEVCYLLARDGGSHQEAAFLRAFQEGFLTVADLNANDLARAAELVEQYRDLPLGGADASVVALAERHRVVDVMTLDRRHFTVVRPRHVQFFTLLPEAA